MTLTSTSCNRIQKRIRKSRPLITTEPLEVGLARRGWQADGSAMHDFDHGVWCLAGRNSVDDCFFVPIGTGWAIVPRRSLPYEYWRNARREACVDVAIEKAIECQLQFAVSGEPVDVDPGPPF